MKISLKMSREGCNDSESFVYISPNKNKNEKYIVGKVWPADGKCSWSIVINKNMKTIDGTPLSLESGYYDKGVDLNDRHNRIPGVIKFDENN